MIEFKVIPETSNEQEAMNLLRYTVRSVVTFIDED